MLNVGSVQREGEKPAQAAGKIVPRKRPDVTRGFTEKVRIGCGNLYITVNYDDNGICEVFTNLGRAGGCPSERGDQPAGIHRPEGWNGRRYHRRAAQGHPLPFDIAPGRTQGIKLPRRHWEGH